MAKSKKALLEEIGSVLTDVHMALDAMHEMAVNHENGVSSNTLSIVVDQLTENLLPKVMRVEDQIRGEQLV